MAEKKPLAKVVDFELLGALFGPRAPDPDLGRFRIRVKHGILNISLDVRKKVNIGTHGQSMPRWIHVRRHVARTYFITKVAIRVMCVLMRSVHPQNLVHVSQLSPKL